MDTNSLPGLACVMIFGPVEIENYKKARVCRIFQLIHLEKYSLYEILEYYFDYFHVSYFDII